MVLSPGSTGVLPDAHPQNMHVGGSKGSISGNYAMAEAELLIVIGSRAVCQADCSGIGYKSAQAVININGDLADAHALQPARWRWSATSAPSPSGCAADARSRRRCRQTSATWLAACAAKKAEWAAYKRARFDGRADRTTRSGSGRC